MSRITPAELALWQAHALDFTLLDLRRDVARKSDGAEIAGMRGQ